MTLSARMMEAEFFLLHTMVQNALTVFGFVADVLLVGADAQLAAVDIHRCAADCC